MQDNFKAEPFPLFVSTQSFFPISVILSLISLVFISFFIVYEFRFPRLKRSLKDELIVSFAGSLTLGLGLTFALLSFGLYF
ncbi:Uncharacterized protein cmbei_7002160 [Cryptosporidium meleagridis]